MAFIDYYKIMGIDKNTPQSEIRSAYKKRAKLFHPDLHPNDPKAKAKFQALNEAYDVLNDPEKRKKYDQYGEHWKEAGAFNQGGNAGWGNGNMGGQDFDFSAFEGVGVGGFSSFFEEIFGNRRRKTSRSPFGGGCCRDNTASDDAHASIDIDLYTALLGGELIVQVKDSKIKLRVKPCTQPGTKVRLKGKGNRLPDGTQGDLILTYNVKLPEKLTPYQENLVRQMKTATNQ